MAYEITDAGVEGLADRVGQLIAMPASEFPQFAVALAEVDTLGDDASVTPAGYLVAFDYLRATTQAELTWLRGFASSMRSGRLGRQQTDGAQI